MINIKFFRLLFLCFIKNKIIFSEDNNNLYDIVMIEEKDSTENILQNKENNDYDLTKLFQNFTKYSNLNNKKENVFMENLYDEHSFMDKLLMKDEIITMTDFIAQ